MMLIYIYFQLLGFILFVFGDLLMRKSQPTLFRVEKSTSVLFSVVFSVLVIDINGVVVATLLTGNLLVVFDQGEHVLD